MKKLCVFVLVFFFLLVSCEMDSKKNEDQTNSQNKEEKNSIYGTWCDSGSGDTMVVVFSEDGLFSSKTQTSSGRVCMLGTFIIKDKTIDVTRFGDLFSLDFELSGDMLTLTSEGDSIVLSRMSNDSKQHCELEGVWRSSKEEVTIRIDGTFSYRDIREGRTDSGDGSFYYDEDNKKIYLLMSSGGGGTLTYSISQDCMTLSTNSGNSDTYIKQ